MTIINVTLTATANSDNKTISQPNTKDTWIYTWDGLGGTDKLSFDRLPKSEFVIFSNDTGIHVNSVSGASHKIFTTLTNVETVTFSYGNTVVNLATLFPSDATAPTVTSFSPANAATGVSVTSSITLNFSETIVPGTGNIEIRSGSASGPLVESFNVANSGLLKFSGSTLTIDPTLSLAGNTTYFVILAPDTVRDRAGNSYEGTSTYDFTTGVVVPNQITGTSKNNVLNGTAFIDRINGLAGNDILKGAGDIDILDGGEGSDIYLVSVTGDHPAAEFSDTGLVGVDEVRFSSTVANSTLTLYADDVGIERAVIGTGTAAAAVTKGTTALNIDGSALLSGITLVGNAGNNILTGGQGNDFLVGGAGNDTLVGGAGQDWIDYSAVSKSITINLSLSTAQNTGGAGVDTLTGIENALGGSAADTLTGNDGDNMLTGNAGKDTLIGGDGFDQLRGGNGNDLMTGGAGVDWFIFEFAPNASTNKDTMTDFVSDTDKLLFSQSVFKGLSSAPLGTLGVDAFWTGNTNAAHDASDRFIYNSSTGLLWYDADGTGSSAAVQVALIGTTIHPTLVYSDFVVIA